MPMSDDVRIGEKITMSMATTVWCKGCNKKEELSESIADSNGYYCEECLGKLCEK